MQRNKSFRFILQHIPHFKWCSSINVVACLVAQHGRQHRRQKLFFFFSPWRCGPTLGMASSLLRFLDHTQRRTTVGRTPLDEWSARRRDFYVTTHNTHNRQTSMTPVGYEPTISAGERSQTYALDRAAIGTGRQKQWPYEIALSEQKKQI